MTNGNDCLEFEEQNIERLQGEFVKQNQKLWDDFINKEFNEKDSE